MTNSFLPNLGTKSRLILFTAVLSSREVFGRTLGSRIVQFPGVCIPILLPFAGPATTAICTRLLAANLLLIRQSLGHKDCDLEFTFGEICSKLCGLSLEAIGLLIFDESKHVSRTASPFKTESSPTRLKSPEVVRRLASAMPGCAHDGERELACLVATRSDEGPDCDSIMSGLPAPRHGR